MYRSRFFALLLVFLCPRIASAQAALPNDPSPQSARQALLEMFFSGTPYQFFSHLPKHAQQLMKRDGTILPLQALSLPLTQLQTQEGKLDTFDNGPILLRSENSYSHRTIEVEVESESDGFYEDQLQLSLHLYRGGKPEPLPFVPAATFTMKLESGIWRLDDIAVNLRIPLGDREFLDSLIPGGGSPHVEEQEAIALSHLRTLATAQVSYAATFPELGFACSLAYLGGAGVDEPTSTSAELIDSGLSSGNLDGYLFSIEDCTGSPVDHFSISAITENPQTGLRTFCSDESAVIRFSEDSSAPRCLSDGEPVP
jgi:hypothetical protein